MYTLAKTSDRRKLGLMCKDVDLFIERDDLFELYKDDVLVAVFLNKAEAEKILSVLGGKPLGDLSEGCM